MTPRVHCAGMGGQLTTRPKRKTGPEIEGLPRLVRLLAHDVNNPLTAVRILAEMNAEGELAADMHDILEAADLAAALLEAMDALMREDHRRTYSFFPMRLDEVLARVADRPALARIVSTDVPSDLLATGDQSALERALSDVLFNARQLAGGGPIHVRARRGGPGASAAARRPGPAWRSACAARDDGAGAGLWPVLRALGGGGHGGGHGVP